MAVIAEPDPQSWEREDWSRFWSEVAETFIESLLEAVANPKIKLHFKKYTLGPNVVADGQNSEIYFVIHVGDKEKRLPGSKSYWPTEPGQQNQLYTDDKVFFAIPPFKDFHYVLIDVFDYDPFNQDDRLDWIVFKYNTSSQTAHIIDRKGNTAVVLHLNFETRRDIE